MTGRTKGGSPTGNRRAEFIDAIVELLKEKGDSESKIKEIRALSLSTVYIGAFNEEAKRYYIMKKPVGQELADAHLDILLDMQAATPTVEEHDSQGNAIIQVSPAATTARKKAMKAWFTHILPQMLIYPEIDELNFAEQFFMFNVVFSEMERGISTFQFLQ